jgi:uncharacterized protein YndB with AHSA1/START domain
MADELGEVTAQGATRSVTHRHRLLAPSAGVWDAITQPVEIARWMRTESMFFEPHVGGSVHYVWGGGSESTGTVMLFEPRRTLAFTWHEESNVSTVRFDLSEDGDATLLTLRHRDLTPVQLPGIAAGWHTHLEYLAAVLAGVPFEFDPRFEELLPQYTAAASRL